MATVREDVVKLTFDFDQRGMHRANDAIDDMISNVQTLGGKSGTGKVEDGFESATKAAKGLGKVDLSGLADGLESAASAAGRLLTSLGGIAASGIIAGITAGAAAVGAMGTAAIAGYADYEQLVGGVETLFGVGDTFDDYVADVGKSTASIMAFQKEAGIAVDGIMGPETLAAMEKRYARFAEAPDIVLKNADNAWQTAGLSANEYIQTVTGFSASLMQGLGGDTVAAAELSDQALRDMADNANKMGTDMDSIMYSYMGFSKGNFTMLDNLNTMGALAA